jgi:hypothetical protein
MSASDNSDESDRQKCPSEQGPCLSFQWGKKTAIEQVLTVISLLIFTASPT